MSECTLNGCTKPQAICRSGKPSWYCKQHHELRYTNVVITTKRVPIPGAPRLAKHQPT